jgi:hypothetical protein
MAVCDICGKNKIFTGKFGDSIVCRQCGDKIRNRLLKQVRDSDTVSGNGNIKREAPDDD